MGKKILALSLAVAMVLSVVACVQLPPAQEIVDGVIGAWDDIITCDFDIDMTMDMVVEAEGETVEMTTVTDSSGVLDLENEEMMMDITMSMTMLGLDMEMLMEVYLIGDMMYMYTEAPGMEPTWVKSEMAEGTWEDMNQVEPQIVFLEAAQVEVVGSARVRGVDCYVLEVTPDMEQVWEVVMQQAELTEEVFPFTEEMFRSLTVKQWVAKDTYYLAKAEIDMSVEFTAEAMGFPEEEGAITMDIALSLLAYDYNQPVSVELPPEAEGAIEMSL